MIEDQATSLDQTATDLDHTLVEHADMLRAQLDQHRARSEELRRQLDESEEVVKRIQRAIDALTGETPKQKLARAKGGRRDEAVTKQRAAFAAWVPKPEKVEQVYQALCEHGADGIHVAGLAKATGFSGETVRRSLELLRTQERARSVGVRKLGRSQQKTKHYKPMEPSTNGNGASHGE